MSDVFSRSNCIFNYCPSPDLCDVTCRHPTDNPAKAPEPTRCEMCGDSGKIPILDPATQKVTGELDCPFCVASPAVPAQEAICKCGKPLYRGLSMPYVHNEADDAACAEPKAGAQVPDDLTQLYEEAKRNGAGTYSGSHITSLIDWLRVAREERDAAKEETDKYVAYWRDNFKDEEKRWCDLAIQYAAEREARKQAEDKAQLHNDAAVEAIQRSQEYMSKYDRLVADGWDELKKVAGERDKAFNAGIEAAAKVACGFCGGGSYSNVEEKSHAPVNDPRLFHHLKSNGEAYAICYAGAIHRLSKPVQEPAERECGK
jgi:hypothetical protein